MKFAFSVLGIFLFIFSSCNAKVNIENISRAPELVESDKKYAGVFTALDGKWQGRFYIYEDTAGQQSGLVQPQNLQKINLADLPLRLIKTIEVTQKYVSESPYFQRVYIQDTFLDDHNKKRIEKSRGVNKIQNGKMWCVVVKPDETVVHSGVMEGDHTFIWQRNIRDPLKIEYFREVVKDRSYQIWGWGYYGQDNPNLSPHYWFYGDYKRR